VLILPHTALHSLATDNGRIEMPVVLIHDIRQFCTNGYPDPDVLIKHLTLIRQYAKLLLREYGEPSETGRRTLKLLGDVTAEMSLMGAFNQPTAAEVVDKSANEQKIRLMICGRGAACLPKVLKSTR
jgi:hypothetical protein